MITGQKIYEAEQYKAPKNTYGKGHLEILEILSKKEKILKYPSQDEIKEHYWNWKLKQNKK